MDEICAAVDYLVSPGARNITGQCIVIDGGWTAQ
jgi:3-hydroxybutyrate dehydrogenase